MQSDSCDYDNVNGRTALVDKDLESRSVRVGPLWTALDHRSGPPLSTPLQQPLSHTRIHLPPVSLGALCGISHHTPLTPSMATQYL